MSKKQEIIEAAMMLFREQGTKATSMQQVADKVGISKGAIYMHFRSKTHLVTAILEHLDDFHIIGLQLPETLRDNRWRVMVDEEPDYQLMDSLYQALWDQQPVVLQDAIDWLQTHPELAQTNQDVQHSAINQELSHKRIQLTVKLAGMVGWSGE